MRQHTAAYGSIRQHTSAYVRIRQRTPAYAAHASAYLLRSLAKLNLKSAHAACIGRRNSMYAYPKCCCVSASRGIVTCVMHGAFSYWCMRPDGTSVYGLDVREGFS